MTWVDELRHWNYDIGPIITWFLNIAEFHIQRIGWPAYVGLTLAVIFIGLSIPATRGMTSLLVSGAVRSVFSYLQIVISLLTVGIIGWAGKIMLSQFNRLRRWIGAILESHKP